MSAAASWLEAGAFGAPYPYVALATVAWFMLIYAAIAGGAYLAVVDRLPATLQGGDGRTQRMRPGQIRDELFLSLMSILIFAGQAVGLVWLLRNGWLDASWDRSAWHLAWELPVLYLWNELHFFAIHRLLHWPPLYRTIHIRHHRSVITTPFSAYSFHPVESFLLGSVMPLALVLHPFSPLALIGLTIMSLLINVAGHLPHERVRSAFAFAAPHARYHNQHHRQFHTHFGFSLTLLDRWFSRPRPDESGHR
jgi:sterol desaturase/sphingolipid hydroxylase (fatty acid hydroxylase superfamily)